MEEEKQRSSFFRSSSRESDGDSDEDSETNQLIQALATQAFHLPGYSWCQDWWQFVVANNHPVFGILCHHKLHPIKFVTRVVALIGIITFGLAITNLCYVFFLWNPEYDRVLASIVLENGTVLELTTSMLTLYTIGSGIHCMFNLAIWHIAACACCQSGGFLESCACCPSLGKHMVRFFVFCIVAFAALIVILRVASNDRLEELGVESYYANSTAFNVRFDDELDLSVESIAEFDFVLNYLVQITLSLFVYYPLFGTIFFSGILSCGYNIPRLGGRPYEMAREERRKSRAQRRGESISSPKSSDSV